MNQIGTTADIPAAPKGFSVVVDGPDAVVIHHRRTGMKGMLLFLCVWLTVWTAGCVSLLVAYLKGGSMENGSPMPLVFVLGFWASEIGVICFLGYLFFAHKSFRLDKDSMVVELRVFRYRRVRSVPRQSFRSFVQIQDGGKGEDSFPSWGLRADTADGPLTLIFRQPYETSQWLGQVLAQWAETEFIPAEKP
jgi:hypothetical protein